MVGTPRGPGGSGPCPGRCWSCRRRGRGAAARLAQAWAMAAKTGVPGSGRPAAEGTGITLAAAAGEVPHRAGRWRRSPGVEAHDVEGLANRRREQAEQDGQDLVAALARAPRVEHQGAGAVGRVGRRGPGHGDARWPPPSGGGSRPGPARCRTGGSSRSRRPTRRRGGRQVVSPRRAARRLRGGGPDVRPVPTTGRAATSGEGRRRPVRPSGALRSGQRSRVAGGSTTARRSVRTIPAVATATGAARPMVPALWPRLGRE